jgi:DNA-binding transcriptional LysR family regulator
MVGVVSASGGLMEFRHIRSFLSVVETLHFGRSARFLNVGNPAH